MKKLVFEKMIFLNQKKYLTIPWGGGGIDHEKYESELRNEV